MTSKMYETVLRSLVSKPNLQPRNGQTFCNSFVNEVAHFFNYHGFDNLMANQIVDLMESDSHFTKVNSPAVEIMKAMVSTPKLIIAGQKAAGHGHVCVVNP